MLLEKNVVVINDQDGNGNTPLHVAVIQKKYNIVKLLMKSYKNSVRTDIKNKDKKTPIDLTTDAQIIDLLQNNEQT